MRVSRPEDWQKLWTKREIDDIYPTQDAVIDSLCSQVEVRGKRVLEVGAGSGRDSLRLARMGARVFVVDYVSESLNVIREQADREGLPVCCIQGDALKLPIDSGSFDIVFHQGLLEHFRSPSDLELLRENYRILKPGGHVLVDVPQTFHIYTLIKGILIFFGKWFAGWETQYTPRQLRRRIEAAGFVQTFAYGLWMQPSLFYRIAREVAWRTRLARLPMYPPELPVWRDIRRWVRERSRTTVVGRWTALQIGSIARK